MAGLIAMRFGIETTMIGGVSGFQIASSRRREIPAWLAGEARPPVLGGADPAGGSDHAQAQGRARPRRVEGRPARSVRGMLAAWLFEEARSDRFGRVQKAEKFSINFSYTIPLSFKNSSSSFLANFFASSN